MSATEDDVRKAYAEFQEKVRRTVYLDNLSPKVTEVVIRTALEQFGNVVKIDFIPNYTIPYPIPQAALVEMKDEKGAHDIITLMNNYPFMISGMPRPVRAMAAKPEMFHDRPPPPDRKVRLQFLNPSDPNFEVAKKLKQLYRKHTAEHLAIIKLQLEEQENLASQQSAVLKANYKKYELMDNLMKDGTAARLASFYELLYMLKKWWYTKAGIKDGVNWANVLRDACSSCLFGGNMILCILWPNDFLQKKIDFALACYAYASRKTRYVFCKQQKNGDNVMPAPYPN